MHYQINHKTMKAKIMVHWDSQKIVHCTAPTGSDEYRTLLKQGYVEVGEIKSVDPTKIYWDIKFLEPGDKYLANPSQRPDTWIGGSSILRPDSEMGYKNIDEIHG